MQNWYEIDVGAYGRMMFEQMTSANSNNIDHWESIRAKAEPLVRELIKLNEEMKPTGYNILGYSEKGKKKLSKHERIDAAQEKLWKVEASTLKVGDLVWLVDSDHEMYIVQSQPCPVEYKKKDTIGVSIDMWGEDVIVKIHKTDEVFKAPADFDEKEELYTSEKYWLKQADKLGI